MPNTLSRRRFAAMILSTGVAARLPNARAIGQTRTEVSDRAFAHPGLLHSSADLRRMRKAVAAKQDPIFAGFQKLREHPQSQSTYVPAGASPEIGRNPNLRFGEFDRDCNAAYQCALMGSITGDPAFWRVVVRILDDWASTLRSISGADAILCASLGGFKLINAAELARWNGAAWSAEGIAAFEELLRNVIIPVLQGFAPFANGNWDTAAMKALLAASVFLDDGVLFERVLVYYNHGYGDGRLTNYIYANGQCQESGRDQQHTQLGLAHLGDCCEIAWNQGLDLYGMSENRLLVGFEYTARYELGEDVPFEPDIDRTGKYTHRVISPRSPLRPVYEQIFNHYVRRRGLAAPWTEKAASALRPEGAGFQADHTGFGTLLYSRTGADIPTDGRVQAAVAGLHASNEGVGLQLNWVPAVAGRQLEIVRVGPGVARRTFFVESSAATFLDRAVTPGKTYRYDLEVAGKHARAARLAAFAGCPFGWRTLPTQPGGDVFYDGMAWRLSGTGVELSRMFSVVTRIGTAQRVVARLLPEFASAQMHAGLVIASSEGDLAATLLLEPMAPSASERGDWTVRLRSSSKPKGALEVRGEQRLVSPQVVYGRVRTPLWLRLWWDSDLLHAESSADGVSWQVVGAAEVASEGALAGLALTSGLEDVWADALFDHVELGQR